GSASRPLDACLELGGVSCPIPGLRVITGGSTVGSTETMEKFSDWIVGSVVVMLVAVLVGLFGIDGLESSGDALTQNEWQAS
ncbi:MAG: hypothetical protein M3132_03055, partial [Actinomycetia bacterium]|nr:hypothetical protein [Actinomycetes bacterium]